MKVRQAHFAGSFYPADPAELRQQIKSFLAKARVQEVPKKTLRALIVPHAGYVYSGAVAAVAYRQLQAVQPRKIIIIGLSHQNWFAGLAYARYDGWETPLGIIKIDNSAVADQTGFIRSNAAHEHEHSIEVQLPFLQTVGPAAVITPLLTSDEYKGYADKLAPLARDHFIIASSDLSHYLPYAQACGLDQQTINKIRNFEMLDPMQNEACGGFGINILSGIAKKLNWEPLLLDYKNSGDTAGDKDAVVGYCAIGYYS